MTVMQRTAGKDPRVMKTKKTPRAKHSKAKSPSRLGEGSEQEWAPRPDKAQPNGARQKKKSRAGGGGSSGSAQGGASGGSGGGAEVPFIDEGVQPPTTSSAATEASVTRKRKSTSEGDGGGRQRRSRAKKNKAAAAAAAAATASTTSSTTRTRTTRGTRQTTGGGGGGSSSGISPPASTTPTSPPSTASPVYPVTRENITSAIREQLATEQRELWDETTQRPSWTPRQGKVEPKDIKSQAEVSTLKKTLTRREVPLHAAGVGPVVFREGVVWDTLTCKILAFPVNAQHFMGGPTAYKGKNAAVVWGNNVYWRGEDGSLIDNQCCTAHYLGQVMQRCGLVNVFVCDASGVAHPRSGSGLKKGHAGTRELVTAHVQYLLGSGRRMLEVHSRGTTLRFIEVLEEMATAGHADISIKIGSGNVRVHVFFGVPCGPDGELDTVNLFGTDHHSMMRFSFVANSIIRSQIAASALAGHPLNQAQTDNLWAMSTTGSLSPEEWREYYADLVDELGEEQLAKFEEFVEEMHGDMDRAYQSLISWKGGMAAPTTKAKKGGEWQTALDERREEAARLEAKPRTRGNAKAVGKVASDMQEVSSKLEAQYRRWERSVGAMHFGGLAKYEEYTAAMRTARDNKASPDQVAKAKAVVARLERDKKDSMAANGRTGGEESHKKRKAKNPVKYSEEQAAAGTASWTGQTAGWTVKEAEEEVEAAEATLEAATTEEDKAAAQQRVELATVVLGEVETARERRADGGNDSNFGLTKGLSVAGTKAEEAAAQKDLDNASDDAGRAAAKQALDEATKRRKRTETAREDQATGGRSGDRAAKGATGGGDTTGPTAYDGLVVEPPPELRTVSLTCATEGCSAMWNGTPMGVWISAQDFVFIEKQHWNCTFVQETGKWKHGRFTPSPAHRSMRSHRIKTKFQEGKLKPRHEYKTDTA